VRADRRVSRVPPRAGRQARTGGRRLERRPAILRRVRTSLAQQDARCRAAPTDHDERARTGTIPRRDRAQPRPVVPGIQRPARREAVPETGSAGEDLVVAQGMPPRDRVGRNPPTRRITMTSIDRSGTFKLGSRSVKRLGYGAMQLAGPGVFGPPKDPEAARAVLREAIASGVDHIDTSDFYGPHVTNQIIREALHPYPDDLVIVTKIGARRGPDASWLPASSPQALTQAVHDNLRNLGLDVLDAVTLRIMPATRGHGPGEGSIEAPLTALAELQRKGLVHHIGLSNA